MNRPNLSVAETSLRLDKTDDLQSVEVDLQPLVHVAIYLLFRAPSAAALLRSNPINTHVQTRESSVTATGVNQSISHELLSGLSI